MPIRAQAVWDLVKHRRGTKDGHFTIRSVVIGGEEITHEQYEIEKAEADGLLMALAESIPWRRLVIEAHGRCMILGHDHAFEGDSVLKDPVVCGESLQQCLIAPRFHHWNEEEFVNPEEPLDRD